MKTLHIYPTSRSIRQARATLYGGDSLLPSLMRIDEFLRRVVLLPHRVMVDSRLRIMLLHEASRFESFRKLRVDRSMVKFFAKSEAFFKFFEELAQERVTIDDLYSADGYAEFGEHLDTLRLLFERYELLLDARGLSDKALLPKHGLLSEGFIASYDRFELHLEGYLTRYELEIITQIAKQKPFTIHIRTNPFNHKMVERFDTIGVALPPHSDVSFDVGTGDLLTHSSSYPQYHTQVLSAEERLEQIAIAMESIEKMVQGGISPEDIVLIVPDESIITHLDHYDRVNNLNFAMGFDLLSHPYTKKLDAIYRYWTGVDGESIGRLRAYGLYPHELLDEKFGPMGVGGFFELLERFGLNGEGESPLVAEPLERVYYDFVQILGGVTFAPKEWLFMWLQELRNLRIDDNRGGKVTVMGVLESRGVRYKGVVIIDFNEEFVPATTPKDNFLSTSVREFATLPTKHDREALQKYYYSRILENADLSVIIYATANQKLPSKFLYELHLPSATPHPSQLSLLYGGTSRTKEPSDPIVLDFDPTAHVWSSTKLKLFLECKRAFYYRYIARLRVPKNDNDINEGALLHEILCELFEDTTGFESSTTIEKRFESVTQRYLERRRKEWGEDSRLGFYEKLWRVRLKGFFELQAEQFRDGWGVLYREHTLTADIGGLEFEGKIDRVDSRDSTIRVLDYKTSLSPTLNRSKNLEKLTDFQMSIYRQLLQTKGYTTQILEYIKLFDEGHFEEVKELEAKTELLYEHLITLKQTSTFTASRCEETTPCTYCDYQLNCERGVYML